MGYGHNKLKDRKIGERIRVKITTSATQSGFVWIEGTYLGVVPSANGRQPALETPWFTRYPFGPEAEIVRVEKRP